MRWHIPIVALLLGAMAAVANAAEPKTVLFLGQNPDGHPPKTHEHMAGLELLAILLKPRADVKIQIVKADEPSSEGPQLLEHADGVVLFLAEGARWVQAEPRRYDALTRMAARGGGGGGALHWAIGTKSAEPITPFLKLLGGCHGGPDRKYEVVETEVRIVDPTHPVAAGLRNFRVRDEFCYQLKFVPPPQTIRPVFEATIAGQAQTVAWSWDRPDGGRSFGFSGLHFHDNWNLPEYQKLLTQAVQWTMKMQN